MPMPWKKAASYGICHSAITLPINIAMIVIGSSYDGVEHCKFRVPNYLMISGGVGSAASILGSLGCLATWTQTKLDDICIAATTFVALIAYLCIVIWGSVVVFKEYPIWDNTNQESNNFCAEVPFMFAFVYLIICWVSLAVILGLGSTFMFTTFYWYKAVSRNNLADI